MIAFLLFTQLVLCALILQREVLQLQFRNLASSIFFVIYLVVFVIEPLVLHLFFGGARSIVNGGAEYFSDASVYYLFNAYGIALLLTRLLFGGADFRT